MKKFVVLAATAAAFAATPAMAAPGDTDTEAGVATATVVAPITLTHVPAASLAFGSFTAGNGGTVVVTPAGLATSTGEVDHVTGSVESADAFTVSGDAGRAYSISTGAGTVTFLTNSMAFTTTPSAAAGTLTGGAGAFTVGGTLTVGSGQAAGNYTGSYDATVTYN